ncbi:hypothetical protein H9P43_002421 [Blastocladiella emersonii ATCC 22665]|nr:hypothetical protein H9P43_002421 [Blastocladiella emersonii ATCC 22665]
MQYTRIRFTDLPNDILVGLLQSLPFPDMARLAATCRDVHALVADPEYWAQLCTQAGVAGPAQSDTAQGDWRAWRDALLEKVNPAVDAVPGITGTWLPHPQWNRPVTDAAAPTKQALLINVWWLELECDLTLQNGDWDFFILTRCRQGHMPSTTKWSVDVFPTTPLHHKPESSDLLPQPIATYSDDVNIGGLPATGAAYEWIPFPTTPGRLVGPPQTSFQWYGATTTPIPEFRELAGPPVQVRSPTGFARVRMSWTDYSNRALYDGWYIAEIRAVRRQRIDAAGGDWRAVIEGDQGSVIGGAIGGIVRGVAGMISSVFSSS